MAASGIELDENDTKTIRITDADTLETFELLLLPDTEPAALALAVSARAGIESTTGFFLTAKSDPKGAVTPLSCKLGDGTSLVLHRVRRNIVQQRQQQPATLAAAAAAVASDVRQSAVLTTSTSGSSALSEPLLARAASINGPPPAATDSPPPLQRGATSMVSNQLEGLERLSRLTTDLANERTLLAWMRTCLAGIRTLFSYLAIGATTAAWQMSIT